jgi:hypothetical protein
MRSTCSLCLRVPFRNFYVLVYYEISGLSVCPRIMLLFSVLSESYQGGL